MSKETKIENNQMEKRYIYIKGKPNTFWEESNNKTIGKFNPMSNSIETITSFCWCLFFILIVKL